MKIVKDEAVIPKKVEMEGAKNVDIQILIGQNEESDNIIMRQFTIAPGGCTPYHNHDFEHVIKVVSGEGVAIDKDNNEHILKPGMSLFVAPNEMHQFRNNSDSENYQFLCIIPGPGMKK